MEAALAQAKMASTLGEIPIGAVIVKDGEILSRAHNLRETTQDPVAHAEVLAIRAAAQSLDSWRLVDCDIYCTLEPCPMCAGAVVNSRIRGIYFGAYDQKAGAICSLYGLTSDPRLNHEAFWVGGMQEKECADLLTGFFDKLRTD